jgi:hypothetical protein
VLSLPLALCRCCAPSSESSHIPLIASRARLCAAIVLSPYSWRERTCDTCGVDGHGGGRGVNCRASPPSACIKRVLVRAPTTARWRAGTSSCTAIRDRRQTRNTLPFGRLYPRERSAAGSLRRSSALCPVSRVTPVQTALRNCTGDEGGPFGFGD